MKRVIDLNADVGEIHPSMTHNVDHHILPFVSSCNIACGFHSGSSELIKKTIDLAILNDVAIGAHPSYKDRENFGRLSLSVPKEVLISQIREQLLLVQKIVNQKGARLHHVKPHGALYNDMAKDRELAMVVLKVIKEIDSRLIVYGLSSSVLIDVAKELNLNYFQEGFADRAYKNSSTLLSRTIDGAVITDVQQVVIQVNRLINQKVVTIDGKEFHLPVDTICLHSDTLNASRLAETIHQFILKQDVELYHS